MKQNLFDEDNKKQPKPEDNENQNKMVMADKYFNGKLVKYRTRDLKNGV